MDEILEKLTHYVLCLSDAQEHGHNANDRPVLCKHLAASAEMFALLHKHQNVSAIETLVKSEVRSHGGSFIAAPSGDRIANAWTAFVKETGIEH
jgi:hypothetical protein